MMIYPANEGIVSSNKEEMEVFRLMGFWCRKEEQIGRYPWARRHLCKIPE